MTASIVQWGLALALAGVGVAWGVVSLRSKRGASNAPADDIRIVSDLATRLRNQGKSQAVAIALQLHAELLKPEEPKA